MIATMWLNINRAKFLKIRLVSYLNNILHFFDFQTKIFVEVIEMKTRSNISN